MTEQPKITIETLSELSEDEAFMLYFIVSNRKMNESRLFRTSKFNSLGFEVFRVYLRKLEKLGVIIIEEVEEDRILSINEDYSGILDSFKTIFEIAHYSLGDSEE